MKLNFRNYGQEKLDNFVILHGLYGSSDNWMTIARQLSQKYHVVCFDLRNHGFSPHEKSMTYNEMSVDVFDTLTDVLDINRCVLLGHSMGGKIAMTMVEMFPQLVEKLIVVDISPFDYNQQNGVFTSHGTILEALLKLNLEELQSRTEADKALEQSIPEVGLRNFLLKSLHREDGRWKWKININSICQHLPHIRGAVEISDKISTPTLFIKGEKSDYISNNDFENIPKKFPNSTIETVKNAGHWVHAEQPFEFLNIILKFLP